MFFAVAVFVYSGVLWFSNGQEPAIRLLEYNGHKVRTTYRVDKKFLGTYKGTKDGFLVLRGDGAGVYRHDSPFPSASSCPEGDIEFIWGFIAEEDGGIVRFERPYGYSYPVVLVSTGAVSFQACSSAAMLDYLLEYRDGSLRVSSSNDWSKQ